MNDFSKGKKFPINNLQKIIVHYTDYEPETPQKKQIQITDIPHLISEFPLQSNDVELDYFELFYPEYSILLFMETPLHIKQDGYYYNLFVTYEDISGNYGGSIYWTCKLTKNSCSMFSSNKDCEDFEDTILCRILISMYMSQGGGGGGAR